MKYLKSFIPRHIKNRTVLLIYALLRSNTNKIPADVILQNARENTAAFHHKNQIYIPDKPAYIENQSQWGNIRFGNGKKSDMARSGCGIIATYNALAALHESVSPDVMAGLISSFEWDGAVFDGDFGAAPGAIYDYFKDDGFDAVMTAKRDIKAIDDIGKNYDVVIVTAYNDKDDITEMVHTVCMNRTESGGYVVHNAYHIIGGKWAEKATNTQVLSDAITRIGGNSMAICVIGIRQKAAALS